MDAAVQVPQDLYEATADSVGAYTPVTQPPAQMPVIAAPPSPPAQPRMDADSEQAEENHQEGEEEEEEDGEPHFLTQMEKLRVSCWLVCLPLRWPYISLFLKTDTLSHCLSNFPNRLSFCQRRIASQKTRNDTYMTEYQASYRAWNSQKKKRAVVSL